MITPQRLRAVRRIADAVDLVNEMGFTAPAVPVDATQLGLGDFPDNRVVRSARSRRSGYAVFVGELPGRPRSLKPFATKLLREFHDHPLTVLGVRGPGATWERFIVVRPQDVPGQIGAVRVAKLEVDVSSPTHHDADVLNSIAWQSQLDDTAAQARIDRGLDAERVTKRFYLDLAVHHERIKAALRVAMDANPAVRDGVKDAAGAGASPEERVGLRILTQVLFCWFLGPNVDARVSVGWTTIPSSIAAMARTGTPRRSPRHGATGRAGMTSREPPSEARSDSLRSTVCGPGSHRWRSRLARISAWSRT